MPAKKNFETTKLLMNISKSLIDRVDEYAMGMNINRTSAISVLLTQALDNQKALNELSELLELYKKEVDKKEQK